MILVNNDGAGHGQCVAAGGYDVEQRSAASVHSVGPVKDRTGPSKFRTEILGPDRTISSTGHDRSVRSRMGHKRAEKPACSVQPELQGRTQLLLTCCRPSENQGITGRCLRPKKRHLKKASRGGPAMGVAKEDTPRKGPGHAMALSARRDSKEDYILWHAALRGPSRGSRAALITWLCDHPVGDVSAQDDNCRGRATGRG